MKRLYGCGTALVTPFKLDGEVDYDAYRLLVRRQVTAEVDFLIALGTTAETSCLTQLEKQNLVEITLSEAGKIPVLIGVGSNCTQEVVKNIQNFDSTQAYGYLVVVPYYNKPSQEGLFLHYHKISKVTDKRIVLYNNPSRTGVGLASETILSLATLPNIIGIKEASSCYGTVGEVIAKAPKDFSVLSGNDEDTLPLIALGAQGVISTVANIVPKQMVKLTRSALEDDFTTARTMHYQLRELFINCFKETNPQPIKGVMASLGMMENVLRLPLIPANKKLIDLILLNLEQIK